MRVVGETVYIYTPGPPDEWGVPDPDKAIRVPIPGCVVVPRGATVALAESQVGWWSTENVDVLTPGPVSVPVAQELEIRGKIWKVSAEPFQHISPYGTGRGGTQIPATRGEVTPP